MKIVVIGDGGWGTALALTLLANGHEVVLWGAFPDYVAQMARERANPTYLPGIALPAGLEVTAERAAARGADAAVLAVPTRFFRQVVESFRPFLPAGIPVVSVAKGLDPVTGQRMTDVAGEALGWGPAAVLSGPSHAEEVARRVPTAVVVACADAGRAELVRGLFMNSRFRIYTSDDVIGVELGGALKNVIAVAVGISDGVGFGDNTRAALITRGLAEITRLGCACGARAATFAGLSGMGDLIVTCTSRLSRNRAVGERLGRGESIDAIARGMKQVAEGVGNCATARALARARGIEAPIAEQVFAVIHEGKKPLDVLEELMARSAKPES